MPARSSIRGIALLEALAALLVLTAGLATSAALLIRTLHHGTEAAQRTTALRLARSLAEDLRALRRPDGQALRAAAGEDPEQACATSAESCPMERAIAWRMASWREELDAQLPTGARGSIAIADPALAAYVISIVWPAAGASTTASLTLPVET